MMLELPFLWLRPLYYLTSSLTLQSFLWRLLSASLPNLKPEIIKVNNQGHIKFELLVVRVEKVKVIQNLNCNFWSCNQSFWQIPLMFKACRKTKQDKSKNCVEYYIATKCQGHLKNVFHSCHSSQIGLFWGLKMNIYFDQYLTWTLKPHLNITYVSSGQTLDLLDMYPVTISQTKPWKTWSPKMC